MPATKAFRLLTPRTQYLKASGPSACAPRRWRLGVRTARDLLYHVPRRYEDASTVAPIGSLDVGMDATIIGEVVSKGVIPTRSGLRIFQAVLRDETGLIECSWPGQPFLDRTIRKGDLLLVTGPVRYLPAAADAAAEYGCWAAPMRRTAPRGGSCPFTRPRRGSRSVCCGASSMRT